MIPSRFSLLACLTAMIACAAPTPPAAEDVRGGTQGALGVWGGTEASVSLSRAGGAVGYACGAGTIDSAWTVSQNGQFRATGGHFFGGGPIPGGGHPPHPAVYTGQIDGSTMVFTVKLTDLNQVLGPFRMVRGGAVVHDMCV